jgi:hypothetical protein
MRLYKVVLREHKKVKEHLMFGHQSKTTIYYLVEISRAIFYSTIGTDFLFHTVTGLAIKVDLTTP